MKWVEGFLNESLQIAFPNNVLLSKIKQSISAEEKRGGVSRALSDLKENDTIRLALKRADFDRLKSVFHTTNENF